MSAEETRTTWTGAEIAALEFSFAHPLDQDAQVGIVSLSRLAGFARAGVNLVRVAPGRRAFPHHRHHGEEEWLYVIAGEAELRIGDRRERLGPGGFAAFHPGGPAHSVSNPGEAELVCLMGGESTRHEVVDFPDQGRRVIRGPDGARIMPLEDEAFDFFARTPLPGRGE